MASYKQPCIQCGEFIERDVRRCPKCGSDTPFGFACPACLRSVSKEDMLCGGCGRPLHVACPHCGGATFVGSRCERCGNSLMLPCPNRKCGQPVFFENTVCNACGKKVKRRR